MEKYYEVINQLLSLLDTMEEGLLHIQNQLDELRYEEALIILQDILEGLYSIENAIEPMLEGLPLNEVSSLSIILVRNLEQVVTSYEEGRQSNTALYVGKDLLVAFKNWKTEIERVLRPFIVS